MTEIRTIDDLPDYATPAEVAEILRCGARYVQTECKRGRMGHLIIAARYVIKPDHVREYIAKRERSCLSEIGGLPYNGARKARTGKSSGSNTGSDGGVAQAQATAQMLKKSSRAGSSSRNSISAHQPRVIHLNAP